MTGPLVFVDTAATTQRQCARCGTTFAVRYPSIRKRFCGYSCAAKSRPTAPMERNSNWRRGRSQHPLYDVWQDMLARTGRASHHAFSRYGGRGITVCAAWRDDFWAFVADMGPRPEGVTPSGKAAYSVERIDNNGPYSPDNCRWATWSEQNTNRRPYVRADRNEKGQYA